MRADFHVHSTASDGTLGPRELVRLASDSGVTHLSITDHDSVASWPEASSAARDAGIALVPGVELSTRAEDGRDIHLLGYFIDTDDDDLLTVLRSLREDRVDRAHRMIDSLVRSGFSIRLEDVLRHSGSGSVGRRRSFCIGTTRATLPRAMETYLIRTFGCQMNKHDTERVAGLLSDRGLVPSSDPDAADVIVFMTCCVRENADERLRGQVASLKRRKHGRPDDPLIAVGGCIGQRDGETLLERLPHVDVVFGTHNIASLPALLDAAAASRSPQVSVLEDSSEFSTDLPAVRENPWSAWVPITVGCDNFCSYCIVPHVRGREKSRPIEDITGEVSRLVAEGVLEVTLLGQNVNSYGRDRYGEPRFAEVLHAVARTGVTRIRFATSHPKDLSDDTIAALKDLPAVMPYLHLPVQSGSDSVLAAMNRSYTRSAYLALVDRIRGAVPDISLSTDVIVGFPGETEDDFIATLRLVEQVGFDQSFTFIYSPREGTPAASLPETVPYETAQSRLERLVEVVQASSLARKKRLVGREVDVLFEGPSKRDGSVLTGRAPDNTVVHVRWHDQRSAADFAGRILPVRVTEAQTWFVSGDLVEAAAPASTA